MDNKNREPQPRHSITNITEIIKNSLSAISARVKGIGRRLITRSRYAPIIAPLVGVPTGQTVTELNKQNNQNIISTVSFTPKTDEQEEGL